jgi:hypothetical protein
MTATSQQRQAVFDALGEVPEPLWLALVYGMRATNRLLGMVHPHNPPSVQRLDAACVAEIARIVHPP